MYDPKIKVLYLSVYDATSGADAVIEVDPLNPTTFIQNGLAHRGWGPSSGPRRADSATYQPNPLTPVSGYCGTALSIQNATGCNIVKHPRVEGYKDHVTSKGWYSVFRGLALDLSSALTGVYAVHNMHGATALDPMYKFKIVKYVKHAGTDCSVTTPWQQCVTGFANGREPTFTYPGDGIIDAMSSNEATGHVVYKLSPTDGTSTAKIGMLDPSLSPVSEVTLDATRLPILESICSSCVAAYDALKFETAIYAQSGGKNYVIFAGAARMETNGTSYPAIYKVNADRDDFMGTFVPNGGKEMYLNPADTGVSVTHVCEGVTDPLRQGRYTTFTALAVHGAYGYAGTAGRDENCADCQHRSACIFMFSLDFDSRARPTKMIELNGGNGGLDEKDVWAAIVDPNAGFIYFAVGPRSRTDFGRIVKVMIGGTDTAPSCTSGCFKRVGTFKESVPFGGIAYVADLHGIVSASQEASTVTYTKFSTASVTSITPQFVPAQTTGTLVTISGNGFYSHNYKGDTSVSHNISCRFGHTSTNDASFKISGWSNATFVSSTEVRCAVPSATSSDSTDATDPTYAEVQLSFDGYPSATADSSIAWQSSLFTNDNAIVFYYDAPIFTALDVSSRGMFLSKVLFTGEDPDLVPITLRVYGGRFIDSDGSMSGSTARLTCRYNGDGTSDIPGSYVSVSEVRCPLCVTNTPAGASGPRCGSHGSTGAAQYIPFAWLQNSTPKSDVDVSISMNGIDFHSAGTQVLHVYGSPYGLSVTHSRISAQAYRANAETDGTLKLDPVTVALVDVQGTTVPNDMGLDGRTRGFNITAAVNATGSTGGSSAQLAVTSASAMQTTINGTTTFNIVLDKVPLVGMYQIFFTGADCTNGSPCKALNATAAFTFTVEAGIATGLVVDPGGTSGAFVTGPDFPTDTIDVISAQSVPLGYVIVNTIDAGGNKLETLDILEHNVTASIVTTHVVNGAHVARTSGAVLGGTTSRLTSKGSITFSDLTLVAAAPSGSRLPNSATAITYGDPTRGAHGTEAKYLIQFSASLAGSTTVSHTVVRISVGAAVYLRLNSSSYSAVSGKHQIDDPCDVKFFFFFLN